MVSGSLRCEVILKSSPNEPSQLTEAVESTFQGCTSGGRSISRLKIAHRAEARKQLLLRDGQSTYLQAKSQVHPFQQGCHSAATARLEKSTETLVKAVGLVSKEEDLQLLLHH
jgi:hypothetical protein